MNAQYESPVIEELGSVADFTRGDFGRGSSDRFVIFDAPFLS